MNTKLTLTIEQSIIEKAKKYASERGRSLSDIVENYLKAITKEEDKKGEDELTPIVKSLKGTFKAPEDFDYKKELSKSLTKKYME
jgi:replicative DNA helicase